jgi:hypothetical protein
LGKERTACWTSLLIKPLKGEKKQGTQQLLLLLLLKAMLLLLDYTGALPSFDPITVGRQWQQRREEGAR